MNINKKRLTEIIEELKKCALQTKSTAQVCIYAGKDNLGREYEIKILAEGNEQLFCDNDDDEYICVK